MLKDDKLDDKVCATRINQEKALKLILIQVQIKYDIYLPDYVFVCELCPFLEVLGLVSFGNVRHNSRIESSLGLYIRSITRSTMTQKAPFC